MCPELASDGVSESECEICSSGVVINDSTLVSGFSGFGGKALEVLRRCHESAESFGGVPAAPIME